MPTGARAGRAARRRDGGGLPRSSTRATPRRQGIPGPDPSSAWRRCGWPGCSPRWCPTSPRSTASRRCSRSRARGCTHAVTPTGRPVLLEAQDRQPLGPAAGASRAGRPRAGPGRSPLAGRPAGPYLLQAAIAACHARARRAEDTDWRGDRPVVRRAGRGSLLDRSSRSTGPSPTAGPSDPHAGLDVLAAHLRRRGAGGVAPAARASAPTCSSGPGGTTRPPRSSVAPPR